MDGPAAKKHRGKAGKRGTKRANVFQRILSPSRRRWAAVLVAPAPRGKPGQHCSIPGWHRSLCHYQPRLTWARIILKAITRSDAARALGLEAERGWSGAPSAPACSTCTSHHLHPSCLVLRPAHPAQAPIEVSFPNPINGKPKVGFPMSHPTQPSPGAVSPAQGKSHVWAELAPRKCLSWAESVGEGGTGRWHGKVPRCQAGRNGAPSWSRRSCCHHKGSTAELLSSSFPLGNPHLSVLEKSRMSARGSWGHSGPSSKRTEDASKAAPRTTTDQALPLSCKHPVFFLSFPNPTIHAPAKHQQILNTWLEAQSIPALPNHFPAPSPSPCQDKTTTSTPEAAPLGIALSAEPKPHSSSPGGWGQGTDKPRSGRATL